MSSSDPTSDVNILAVERATEESSAYLKSAGVAPLVRRRKLLACHRPELYQVEAEFLVIVLRDTDRSLIVDAEDLAEAVQDAVERRMSSLLKQDERCSSTFEKFLQRLRGLTELEVGSVVTSMIQWSNSPERSNGMDGLARYFNLKRESGVTRHG